MSSLLAFLKKIRKRKTAIILHSLADVDGVASAFALKSFLKHAFVVPSDQLTSPAKHILNELGLKADAFPEGCRELILVDTNSKRMLGSAFREMSFSAVVDHHSRHKDSVRAEKFFVDNSFTATSEMVYEALRGQKLGRKICLLLLAGIIADSAGFKSASQKTFEFSAELLQRSKSSFIHARKLAEAPIDFSQRIALLKAAQRVQVERAGSVIIATSSVGSFEASAATALVDLGADYSFVGGRSEEGARISARSSSRVAGQINLSTVMKEIGSEFGGSGGGHPAAAGSNGLKESELEDALKTCAEKIKARLKGAAK